MEATIMNIWVSQSLYSCTFIGWGHDCGLLLLWGYNMVSFHALFLGWKWWNQLSWPFAMFSRKSSPLAACVPRSCEAVSLWTLLYLSNVKCVTRQQQPFRYPEGGLFCLALCSDPSHSAVFLAIYSCLWWVHLLSACCIPCWWFLLDHCKAEQQWPCATSEVFHQTHHTPGTCADISVNGKADNVCSQIFCHYKKLHHSALAKKTLVTVIFLSGLCCCVCVVQRFL